MTDTPLEVKLISQGTTLPPEINRDLLGRVVDEVFDGAIEDTTVIEDIYRLIASAQQAAQVVMPDEHWTPADQQAFAEFMCSHFPYELDSKAVQSLGSAWKDGKANGVRVLLAPALEASR